MFVTPTYPLQRSAILDSGASIHIFNDRSRFLNYQPAPRYDCVFAGDTQVRIHGYGKVLLEVDSPEGAKKMLLKDVAYCQGFACNVVSLRQLHKRGFKWHSSQMIHPWQPPNARFMQRSRQAGPQSQSPLTVKIHAPRRGSAASSTTQG